MPSQRHAASSGFFAPLDDAEMGRTHLRWLVGARWLALAGQAAVVGVAHLAFGLRVNWTFAAIACVACLAVNAGLVAWLRAGRTFSERLVAATVGADLAALGLVLIAFDAPFSPVALAWALLVALAAVIVGSGLVVYVVGRVHHAIEARDKHLELARERVRRNEKLASLATLAAGTAHELASPLSTIAVVASELARALERDGAGDATVEDARLIRSEVERCRKILQRMAADAGETPGGPVERVPLRDLLASAREQSGAGTHVQVELPADMADVALAVPLVALEQAIAGVMRNAVQASAPGQAIRVTARRDGELCVIEVHDRGHGMTPEVLARAGEPFFTSKQPGQGMGLGLFLTRAVLERLGGKLALRSLPGEGTCAELSVPFRGLRLKAVRKKGRNDTAELPTTAVAGATGARPLAEPGPP